ncbi:MAG: hypothetical protein WBS24_03450 [Terriglobales bacterium]
MSTAEQPTLDLGDYRGRGIAETAVRLQNTNDGFDPQTQMDEPRIFEIDEELTVAIRIKVTAHHPKLIEKGDHEGMLRVLQDFKCGTIAIVPDTGVVKKELDRAEANRKNAADAAAKAKEAAKKAAKPPRRAAGAGKLVSLGDSLQAHANAGKVPPANG